MSSSWLSGQKLCYFTLTRLGWEKILNLLKKKRLMHILNTKLIVLQAAWLALMVVTQPVMSASRIDGLYEAQVVVKDQSASERERGIRDALATVLAKLTGRKAVAGSGPFKDILANASRYVNQFQYQTTAGDNGRVYLWISFNQRAIEQVLEQKRISLWGSVRPDSLLWLAVEDKAGRYILANDKANPVYRSLMASASELGIPLQLPAMDQGDRRVARISDIWGNFPGQIKAASGRYQVDNILMAKLYSDGSQWRTDWTLISAADEQTWSGQGKYAGQALADGLRGYTELLMDRYAIQASSDLNRYQLVISNVSTLQAYHATQDYLSGIILIDAIQLHHVSPGQISFLLDLRANLKDLERVLDLQQRLIRDHDYVNPPETINSSEQSGPPLRAESPYETLHYRLKL